MQNKQNKITMSKLTVHVLEVDTKETSETTTLAIQGGTSTVDANATFSITENDPSKFGGLEVGKNYEVLFTEIGTEVESKPAVTEPAVAETTDVPTVSDTTPAVEPTPELPAAPATETPVQ